MITKSLSRIARLALFSAALFGLTACGSSAKSTTDTDKKAGKSSEKNTSITPSADASATKAPVEEKKVTKDYKLDFTPVSGLSEQYVDPDNLAFAYNGQVFRLGVNTIGDLLDAGMEFKNPEIELEFLNHEFGVNQETIAFNFYINSEVRVRFWGFNPTDHLLPCKECVVSSVEFNLVDTIRNSTPEDTIALLVSKIEEANEILKFSFPMDLRLSDLLEKNPNPSENKGVDGVKYMKDSRIHQPTGYYFRFGSDTEILNHFLIRWLPQ